MNEPANPWKGTFGDRLGMVYEEFCPGRAVAALTVLAEHCNPTGVCHGGAIFTFADDAMGGALFQLVPEGHVPTSAQVNIHLVRSARAGDQLRVETRVLSHGRRTATIEARVTDVDQRLVAMATATYLFVAAR